MDPAMIVIFGSTGDLTKRKLIPALYELRRKGRLHECTPIVCVGRRAFDDGSFVRHLEPERFIEGADEESLQGFLRNVRYLHMDIGSATPRDLKEAIKGIEEEFSCSTSKLFYLAVPPSLFGPITDLIVPLKGEGDGWQRVVFEKPFGHDLDSATKLQSSVSEVFDEEDIFRIDHYLGKALVQSILAFRFSNPLFENSWDRDDIERVEIVASEDLGVETRAGYYDRSGALLDMVQNHLLQVLSLVAMDAPSSLEADAIRDRTAEVVRSLRLDSWVRGQYAAGNGMRGYHEEEGVAADSETETYVSLRLLVDTPRWHDVPFIIRTGKRLKARFAHVKVFFKPSRLFSASSPNVLTLRIQPDEGIAFSFNVKRPEQQGLEEVDMDFCHPCHFGPNTAEAYESLLAEVLKGDHTLFPRWDWLEASWSFIDAINERKPPLKRYPAGSDGPAEGS